MSMNDIQLENGFARIANEIFDKLAVTNLNGTQRRILDTVFRFTYGFSRKEHKLSVSFISEYTKLTTRQVKRELNNLISMNVIKVVKEPSFNSSRIIGFNKNFNMWSTKEHQGNNPTPGERLDTSPGEQLDTSPGERLDTQERKYKEKLKEIPIEIFFEELWSIYPNKKGKSKVPLKQKKTLYREVGIEKLKKAILKYSKEVKSRAPEYIMHGSTFFNSGYQDYLGEELKEDSIATNKPEVDKPINLDDEGIKKRNEAYEDCRNKKLSVEEYKQRLKVIIDQHEIR